jgi:hypothetical protein
MKASRRSGAIDYIVYGPHLEAVLADICGVPEYRVHHGIGGSHIVTDTEALFVNFGEVVVRDIDGNVYVYDAVSFNMLYEI